MERRGKTSKNDSWSKSDIKVFYAVVNKSRVDLIRSFLTTKSETRSTHSV